MENLLHITEEITDQRVPTLHGELSKIHAENDGKLSTGRSEYSLKAAYEKAKAAALAGGRLETLCEALRRDIEQIEALVGEVSR